MYAKQLKKTIAIGENALKSSDITDRVINFLTSTLPLFRAHIKASAFVEKEEKPINQKLSIFLNLQSRNYEFTSKKLNPLHFQFTKDLDISGSRRQPDIGVFLGSQSATSNEAFFHIEGKRLPTPPQSGRSDMEYVRGNDIEGGIERFKKEKHGESLAVSALVGYVQDGEFADWHKKINGWIKQLSEDNPDIDINWSKSDYLIDGIKFSRKYGSFIRNLKSKNSRITYPPIVLLHFWLKLT